MNPLLLTDVPDPTDFPPPTSAPGLRELDTSLRCNICGEVYDAPVTITCGHSFCSHCIREALVEKQECPQCRKTTLEGHIRPNSVVEDVVSYWNLSRSYILGLIKENEERQRGSTLITPKAKKRKLTPDTAKRSGASTTTGASSLGSPSNAKRVKKSSSESLTTIPTSDAEEDELPGPSRVDQDPQPDDLVDCPLCCKKVKYKNINLHMDKGCKDVPSISVNSATSDWKKLMAKPSKGKQKVWDRDDDDDGHALPKASYDALKDRKIKEMLIEQGLPVSGDRNHWIKRHQQWVILYNSNLDKSKNRKSRDQLLKDLKKWEQDNSKKKKITVKDPVAHEKRYQGEFAQLVEAARSRANKPDGTSTPVAGKLTLLSKGENGRTLRSADELKPHATTKASRTRAEEGTIVVDSEEEELSPIPRA
ncbi:hypothetical protein H0H87_004985 [Tephrocybe sp. NHM501043]|nr:hypothetical protein H0H87_004985 [Tephrocybe sp. NHM501043]